MGFRLHVCHLHAVSQPRSRKGIGTFSLSIRISSTQFRIVETPVGVQAAVAVFDEEFCPSLAKNLQRNELEINSKRKFKDAALSGRTKEPAFFPPCIGAIENVTLFMMGLDLSNRSRIQACSGDE